jgi:hypothetical protein
MALHLYDTFLVDCVMRRLRVRRKPPDDYERSPWRYTAIEYAFPYLPLDHAKLAAFVRSLPSPPAFYGFDTAGGIRVVLYCEDQPPSASDGHTSAPQRH